MDRRFYQYRKNVGSFMSLQKLGKKDSPMVIANGSIVTELVTKWNCEKNPPPGFDINKIAEIAKLAKEEREK